MLSFPEVTHYFGHAHVKQCLASFIILACYDVSVFGLHCMSLCFFLQVVQSSVPVLPPCPAIVIGPPVTRPRSMLSCPQVVYACCFLS
jgi:hypothetical protein